MLFRSKSKASHSSDNDVPSGKKTAKNKVNKVDINTGTMAELVALPGIGEKTAQKIINGRPYKSVEDLEKVSGISKNKIKKIIKLLSVNNEKSN